MAITRDTLGPSVCPRCSDQMCTPIRSLTRPNVYVSTCRNAQCLHTVHTVVDVAPEPERPFPTSLPLTAEPPKPARTKSAIDEFERAYAAGTSRKAITRARRQAGAVNAGDAQLKRLGRNA